MFGHIEYRDMPGGALGLEPVVVIDPMGYAAIIIIILVAIIIAMCIHIRVQKNIIAEKQCLIDYYYDEDLIK